jgi:acyl carrier protein
LASGYAKDATKPGGCVMQPFMLKKQDDTQAGANKHKDLEMSDIANRVRKIVVDHLSVDEAKVTETASFIDDLGADSLDTVELVMAFEEEFGIEIPDDAAETIQSFGDAVKFITENS